MEEEEEMVKVMRVRGRGGSIPLCAVLVRYRLMRLP